MSDDETTVTDTDESTAEASGPSPEVIAEALAGEVAAARGPEADEVSEALAEQAAADGLESAAIDEEELLAESAAPAPVSPYDRPGKWFVLHTQSGYANKVRQNNKVQ